MNEVKFEGQVALVTGSAADYSGTMADIFDVLADGIAASFAEMRAAQSDRRGAEAISREDAGRDGAGCGGRGGRRRRCDLILGSASCDDRRSQSDRKHTREHIAARGSTAKK